MSWEAATVDERDVSSGQQQTLVREGLHLQEQHPSVSYSPAELLPP